MEGLKDEFCQKVLNVMETETVSVDLTWLDIEELTTALEQRIAFCSRNGAKKEYLHQLKGLINKLIK